MARPIDPELRCAPCSNGRHINHLFGGTCTLEGCQCPIRSLEDAEREAVLMEVPRSCDAGCRHTEGCEAEYSTRAAHFISRSKDKRKRPV